MISAVQAQEAPKAAKPPTAPAPKGTPRLPPELEAINARIDNAEAQVAQAGAHTGSSTWWTTTSAMTMSATVLVFGFLVLCLATYVIRRGQAWEAVLKVFGMVLIVVLVVFLIVAGYDDKQIAPAVGLLGTIAGYLLGKDVAPSNRPPQAPQKPPAQGQVG